MYSICSVYPSKELKDSYMALNKKSKNTRFRTASGGPHSPFGFEEAFKEGKNFNFFSNFRNLKVVYFYSHSWVMGSPWFQNPFINMARADLDKLTNKYELRFIV